MTTTSPIARPRPPRILFKVLNPTFTALLRTPLHGVLSNRLMVLTFQGRKSGKWYSTPVGYTEADGKLLIATESPWWKNLRGGAPVQVTLRGQARTGHATVITDQAGMLAHYRTMLATAPQIAQIVGLRQDQTGEPNPDDVADARQRGHVIVQIRLDKA